jgi:hypothetical protein
MKFVMEKKSTATFNFVLKVLFQKVAADLKITKIHKFERLRLIFDNTFSSTALLQFYDKVVLPILVPFPLIVAGEGHAAGLLATLVGLDLKMNAVHVLR